MLDNFNTMEENSNHERRLQRDRGAREMKNRLKGPGGPWTYELIMTVFSSTIGGSFLQGYFLIAFLGPADVLIEWCSTAYAQILGFALRSEELFLWQILFALFVFGGVIGSLACARLIDRFGRKKIILINDVIVIVGLVFLSSTALADDYAFMSAGCLIAGFYTGMSECVVPVYLHEVSPLCLRGTVCLYHYFMAALGMLTAHILTLPNMFGSQGRWQFIYGFCFLPVFAQLFFFRKCPESPKYTLIIKTFVDQAEMDLCRLRDVDDVLEEIFELRGETLMFASSDRVTLRNLFDGKRCWPMVCACAVSMINPLCGVNILMFLIDWRGYLEVEDAVRHEMFAMMLGYVLAFVIPLNTLDNKRGGRRVLLLVGITGVAISLTCMIYSAELFVSNRERFNQMRFFTVFSIHLAAIFFAIGPGSIPTFITTEFFDTGSRAVAQSTVCALRHLGDAGIFAYFHIVSGDRNEKTFHRFHFMFSPFVLFLAFSFVFTFLFIPETRGRPVDEINGDFERRWNKVPAFIRRNIQRLVGLCRKKQNDGKGSQKTTDEMSNRATTPEHTGDNNPII